MDIAEVARQSGIPASTLRFYEEKGLIASTGRRGLRRTFNSNILERLALIALGQTAGFTLEEISLMFTADGNLQIDRTMLAAKADQIDRTIRQLRAMRNGLRHAAACPAANHLDCPSFQRLMQTAAKGVIGKRHKRFAGAKRSGVEQA